MLCKYVKKKIPKAKDPYSQISFVLLKFPFINESITPETSFGRNKVKALAIIAKITKPMIILLYGVSMLKTLGFFGTCCKTFDEILLCFSAIKKKKCE